MVLTTDAINFRYQGIAIALVALARNLGEPDLAVDVLDGLGLSLEDLEAAGADPRELDALRPA